jgi:antitoxin (DNA-binding transcriptional repressor) of toxin-antitoxin stability system
MKFTTVRDFRTSPKKIWDELGEMQEMVITNNGKPIALLTPLSGANFESTLKAVRQAKAKMSVDKMREISLGRKTDKLSGKDINKIITETRKNTK